MFKMNVAKEERTMRPSTKSLIESEHRLKSGKQNNAIFQDISKQALS